MQNKIITQSLRIIFLPKNVINYVQFIRLKIQEVWLILLEWHCPILSSLLWKFLRIKYNLERKIFRN